MSCGPTNVPCQSGDCLPCSQSNPCYENCGCLNPTTFDCVQNLKQNYPNIPFVIGGYGHEFLSSLDATIASLKARITALESYITTTTTTTTAP